MDAIKKIVILSEEKADCDPSTSFKYRGIAIEYMLPNNKEELYTISDPTILIISKACSCACDGSHRWFWSSVQNGTVVIQFCPSMFHKWRQNWPEIEKVIRNLDRHS